MVGRGSAVSAQQQLTQGLPLSGEASAHLGHCSVRASKLCGLGQLGVRVRQDRLSLFW